MITRRTSMRGPESRASFCHVEICRSEKRVSEGELRARPYTVYLIRLLSDKGTYPREGSWYALHSTRDAEGSHVRLSHALPP